MRLLCAVVYECLRLKKIFIPHNGKRERSERNAEQI
jgi:hypothetical protein